MLNANKNLQSKQAKVFYDEETAEDQDQSPDEMAIMNSDFFNDDIYDYKETFFNQKSRDLAQDEEYGLDYDDDPNGIVYEEEYDEDDRPTIKLDNQNDEEEDAAMMDTFFKRVDSMEFVKPKKAKIINNYLIGELLGDGSYGKVKECLDMESLARRAVKIINLKMVARKIPKGVENVRKEIKIMKKLNHKNLIKLYSTFEKGSLSQTNQQQSSKSNQEDPLLRTTAQMINNLEKPPKLYIFMDYCITSLEKLLKNAPLQRLTNFQANYYFKQLIDGLEYLHSLNIIHNDIKPGNLLITCDDTLKICDFSISADLGMFCEYEYLKTKKIDEQKQQEEEEDMLSESNGGINPNLLANSGTGKFPIQQCTPMFQCPEMLDETIDEILILKNAPKIDIWSSGITLYQLSTGALPFQGQTIHQIFELIRSDSNKIQIPEFIDTNLRNLLSGMLVRDMLKRWSIKQIRESEWFRKKHPVVKEEMAQLPGDVIQNELGTFRMLNYLENYCKDRAEGAAEEGNNNLNNANSNFNLLNQNQPNANLATAENFYTAEGDYSNMPVMSSTQNQPISTEVANTGQPKQYIQATKAKRNHCAVM